jgi:hypothetical protein
LLHDGLFFDMLSLNKGSSFLWYASIS